MALQEVGVEAVVKGLSAFQGDMRSMNNALQGLRGEGTFLQKMFGSVTDGIIGFGEHVVRVAEVTLGVLLRDAIRAAIDFIGDLVKATFEAGSEFQTLDIRLRRLNFNTLIESGMEYEKAAKEAIKLTKEQLSWIQKLAAQSPYDSKDVANVYTLARSYGFAADEAQDLTSDILNFAAGMGLGNTEIQRIIINFGQMVQQGKVTQRELNDLARGAFVPVNDVLKIMQERTGLAGKEFDKFRNSTAGVEMFMSAFAELIETRFAGATKEMAQTFQGATANVLDLVKGIFGLNTVKPILDEIGKRVSAFANAFTDKPERWDRLVAAATRLGEAFSSIVAGVFDLLPSTESVADTVIDLVERAAQWVEDNRENVIGFFKGIADTLRNDVVPWIQDNLIPAIAAMFKWVNDHKDEILDFFADLGKTIIDDVVPFVRDSLIPFFKRFSDWVLENKDQILELFDKLGDAVLELAEFFLPKLEAAMEWIKDNPEKVEKMINMWAKWQFIGTILNVVGGVLLSVAGFVLGLLAAVSGAIGVFQGLAAVISGPVLLILAGLAAQIFQVMIIFRAFTKGIEFWKNYLSGAFQIMKENFENFKDALMRGDWSEVGRAIVDGMREGWSYAWETLKQQIIDDWNGLVETIRNLLGIASPSKVFYGIGVQTMRGMALGIRKSAGLAAASMQTAAGYVTAAAIPSITNSTVYNNTSSYNLTVNSSSPSEPIIQDFSMMESLAGI